MADLAPRVLLDGLLFPEAPRWHNGALWFSDMLAKQVRREDEAGTVTTVASFDDETPGGLGFLPDGTLLVVGTHSGQLFTIVDDAPQRYRDISSLVTGHVDDMVVADDGTAYVGAVGEMTPDAPRDRGAIVRVPMEGDATVEATGVLFPNGIVIVDDVLLVNETFGEGTVAFDIAADGTLSGRRSWAKVAATHPDGLAVDSTGAAWIGCYAESKFIRVEPGGRITDTIDTGGRWATGVALGGADGRTLFMMTADTDFQRFFAGDSKGRIDIVRVDHGA